MKMQNLKLRIQKFGTLLILSIILNFAFLNLNSYAESLSDIKIDALQSPIKETWGRDPFITHTDRTTKLKKNVFNEDVSIDVKVEGIISDGKKAVAIINGGFYRKHERVNNFLIVNIGKDKVTLEKNGKRFYLGIEKFAIEGTPKGEKK